MSDLDVFIKLYRSTTAGRETMKRRLFELADICKQSRAAKPTKKVGLAAARMAATKKIRKEWEKRGMFVTFVENDRGGTSTVFSYMGQNGTDALRLFCMLTVDEYIDMTVVEALEGDLSFRNKIRRVLKEAK